MIYPTKRYIHPIIKETLFRLVYIYILCLLFFSLFFFWFCLTLSCRRLGRLKLPSHSPLLAHLFVLTKCQVTRADQCVQTSWLGHFDFQNLELASLFYLNWTQTEDYATFANGSIQHHQIESSFILFYFIFLNPPAPAAMRNPCTNLISYGNVTSAIAAIRVFDQTSYIV